MSTILIIEDDADVRETLERELTHAGYEVSLASDGEQGIALYRRRPADVVISDLFMPNKGGLETIVEITEEFPQAAIIAISGGHTGSNQLLSVASMLGDVRILEKPFDSETLLTTVASALK